IRGGLSTAGGAARPVSDEGHRRLSERRGGARHPVPDGDDAAPGQAGARPATVGRAPGPRPQGPHPPRAGRVHRPAGARHPPSGAVWARAAGHPARLRGQSARHARPGRRGPGPGSDPRAGVRAPRGRAGARRGRPGAPAGALLRRGRGRDLRAVDRAPGGAGRPPTVGGAAGGPSGRPGRGMTVGESARGMGLRHLAPEHRLRWLELTITRRLDGLLHGEYLGLLPGPGSEPAGSREYRPGEDEVRRMDWAVTARTTTPHVRETDADRELTTWALVD